MKGSSKLFVIVLALIIALGFAACRTAPAPSEPEPDSAAAVEESAAKPEPAEIPATGSDTTGNGGTTDSPATEPEHPDGEEFPVDVSIPVKLEGVSTDPSNRLETIQGIVITTDGPRLQWDPGRCVFLFPEGTMVINLEGATEFQAINYFVGKEFVAKNEKNITITSNDITSVIAQFSMGNQEIVGTFVRTGAPL